MSNSKGLWFIIVLLLVGFFTGWYWYASRSPKQAKIKTVESQKNGKDKAVAQNGNTVKVHYTGRLDDGTVFDSSSNRDPLQFTLGEKQVIPGFDKAVVGMNIGDLKIVKIPVEEAYGEYRQEFVQDVDRKNFPGNIELKVGQSLKIKQKDDRIIPVLVKEIKEKEAKVTLDANHPLAGKDLTFQIQLVEVV